MAKQNYDISQLFEDLLKQKISIQKNLDDALTIIVDNSEKNKAVLTVILTGLLYKYYHPQQDIRLHQASIKNGYSGRSFDTKFVTPFLKANEFPAMSESGWLTRSLEQASPYNLDYPGKITPKNLKAAFLDVYFYIEEEKIDPKHVLANLFQKMATRRDATNIKLSVPTNLTIDSTLELIKKHINYNYKNVAGAARLPSLAIYAVYKTLVADHEGRYKNKILLLDPQVFLH